MWSPFVVWMFPAERVRHTRWRPCMRVFTNGTSEQRSICGFVFGIRTSTHYSVVTTDPVHLPPVMTNLPGKFERTLGHTFGLRTWIEYDVNLANDEFGWADYRLMDAQHRALVGVRHVRLSAGQSASVCHE